MFRRAGIPRKSRVGQFLFEGEATDLIVARPRLKAGASALRPVKQAGQS
jgi:hypothetical protein